MLDQSIISSSEASNTCAPLAYTQSLRNLSGIPLVTQNPLKQPKLFH